MNRWTWIVLVVLVGGLGFLAWRQQEQDHAFTQESLVVLFPGLTEADVVALRVDVVERDVQARFVRDDAVGWRMTDPMKVRAEANVLDSIVRAVLQRQGTPLAAAEVDPRKLGLEPPRIVLELEARDGSRHRLEIGALDLDGQRVHVRARGRVLRTLRDVDSLLDANLEQFQSHSATTIDARDVVEVRRSGSLRRADDLVPQDMAFEAVLDGDRWRMTKPFDVLLDPLQMSLYCGATAGLRFEGFFESGGASLAALGLEPPALTIALTDHTGRTQQLRFGRPDPARPDRWVGLSDVDPTPWRAPDGLVPELAVDPITFADHAILRLAPNQVERIRLSSPEHEVKLEKGVLGWAVSQARAGSDVFDRPTLADARKVEDFVAKLGRSELRAFVPNTTFAANERRAAIAVSGAGLEARIVLGADHETGGVRALREPDTLVSVADSVLLELAASPASAFLGDAIHEVDEVSLLELGLRAGDRERVFVRNRGVWSEKGRTDEARELRDVLDPLLFLRAARRLESLAPPPADPVVVRWKLTNGTEESLTIGRVSLDGSDVVVCDRDGRRSVLQKPELHEKLARIARGP